MGHRPAGHPPKTAAWTQSRRRQGRRQSRTTDAAEGAGVFQQCGGRSTAS